MIAAYGCGNKKIEAEKMTRIFVILGGEVTMMLAGGSAGLVFLIFS